MQPIMPPTTSFVFESFRDTRLETIHGSLEQRSSTADFLIYTMVHQLFRNPVPLEIGLIMSYIRNENYMEA